LPVTFRCVETAPLAISGERFISVIDESTGSIEVFWDKKLTVNPMEWPSKDFPMWGIFEPSQIDNVKRDGWDLRAGNVVREYVQAGNKNIPNYDPKKSFLNFGSKHDDLVHIRTNIQQHDISKWTLKHKWW
jgi:hypothetical protein